jgi:hypothetical protein
MKISIIFSIFKLFIKLISSNLNIEKNEKVNRINSGVICNYFV